MAVYTEVSDDELDEFLDQYDIGKAVSCKGIAEGVENTNYLLQTDRDQFILTLYEKRVRPEDLPFFLGFMEHLAAGGVACPTPIPGRDGKALRTIAGKQAAIVSFLTGVWHRRPTATHCAELGRAMANMHLAGRDFGLTRGNDLSVAGWQALFDECGDGGETVQSGLTAIIADELARLEQDWPTDLPQGVIHADLFPDNVFFLGDKLSGLIDFYFACSDFLVYDVAICLNAWCFEQDGSFNVTKARKMLAAYRSVRPLSEAEINALPILARGAALRFLLTRLYDWLNQIEGAMVKPKNPLEYLARLRFHQSVRQRGDYGLD